MIETNFGSFDFLVSNTEILSAGALKYGNDKKLDGVTRRFGSMKNTLFNAFRINLLVLWLATKFRHCAENFDSDMTLNGYRRVCMATIITPIAQISILDGS